MGNKSSLLLRAEEIAQIQQETGCKYFFSDYIRCLTCSDDQSSMQ